MGFYLLDFVSVLSCPLSTRRLLEKEIGSLTIANFALERVYNDGRRWKRNFDTSSRRTLDMCLFWFGDRTT